MILRIEKYNSSSNKPACYANGQARMNVEYIPDAFSDKLNKQKILLMERDLGIAFNIKAVTS